MRHNPELRGAGKYWLGLGAYVLAVDVFNQETLSNGYSRALRSENLAIRLGTAALSAMTVIHLLDALPRNRDPIDLLADNLRVPWRTPNTGPTSVTES